MTLQSTAAEQISERSIDAINQHALVVEGGAMRGIFASGVLDTFMCHDYRPFSFCIGVSAGSTALASWLSGQYQRNYRIITQYSCQPQFISFKRFVRGGHWLDLDWLWSILAEECEFDMAAFNCQQMPFWIVTTDIGSGEAVYVKGDEHNLDQILKASCSVPIAFRHFPEYEQRAMTDGGIADSIPVQKAYEMGAKEITVVLSRPLGYRKKPAKMKWALQRSLRAHPRLAAAMIARAEQYNRALDFIDNPPTDCTIHVVAPPSDFRVGRLTTDREILEEGYQMGIAAACKQLQK